MKSSSAAGDVDKKPILLIFDIDGTLTYSGGLGRVAFEVTCDKLYGIKNAADGIRPHGRTDNEIFRIILEKNSTPDHPRRSTENFNGQFHRFVEHYTAYYERLLEESDKPRLLPGIQTLLDRLSDEPDVFLALGTGNIKAVSYMKLRYFGIDHYFPVGGFGDEYEDRTELLEFAYQNASQYYRWDFDRQNTWIIGDTPKDIISGRKIGALTIAVATGGIDRDELEQHHPTALFGNLCNYERFVNVIKGHDNES